MNLLSKKILRASLFLLLIIPITWSITSAQDLPDPPKQWTADYVDILTEREENRLNSMLRTYEDTTSNQLMVAIFQNAQGYPVEDFSIRLAEKWLVGQRSRDNGIILAIFMEERKIRVEVGYGLEDVVPDAVAIQIAQNVISPSFKEGKYQQGIFEGVEALMKAAAGKYKGMDKKGGGKKNKIRVPYVFMVFIFIFILSLFRRRRSTSVSSRGYRNSGPFWWGGIGGGRSGGGGFGGGGFSGGGGSFGGGGATGSW
jgi:uncharacterized protein